MWKVLNKKVDLGEPTSFFDHVYLGCSQRPCEVSKGIVDNYRTMFESRISAGGSEKLPFPQNDKKVGTHVAVSSCPPKITSILARFCGRHQNSLGQMLAIQRKEIDLEDPTPLLNQTYVGTQRGAQVDHKQKQICSEELPPQKVTDEKQIQISFNRSPRGVTAWRDAPKHVSKGTVRLLGKTYRHSSQQKRRAWIIIHFLPLYRRLTWQELEDQIYFGR